MSEPVVAIVVAAGSGVRLGGQEPKALRPLAGVPLVSHAVRALASGGVTDVVVVIAEGLQDWFSEVLADAPVPTRLVVGGATRQQSVRRGLAALTAHGAGRVVLVHDAARPLVPAGVVAGVIEAVRAGAVSVVPVVPVADSVRQVDGERSVVVDRTSLRGVQTPQGFDRKVLVACHEQAAAAGVEVTDDAAVCELAGFETVLVPGSRDALKVTEPFDLLIAQAVLETREGAR